ncbi:MAG: RidA family protein [Pseudomonadota bacterium]
MIKRHMKFKSGIGHRAVEHSGILHLSGFIADDLSVGMAGQTEQVLKKIEDTLVELGSSKQQLLSATIFLADFAAKEEMNAVWVSWFDDESLPTRSTIGVSDLGPRVLIEVIVSAAA